MSDDETRAAAWREWLAAWWDRNVCTTVPDGHPWAGPSLLDDADRRRRGWLVGDRTGTTV